MIIFRKQTVYLKIISFLVTVVLAFSIFLLYPHKMYAYAVMPELWESPGDITLIDKSVTDSADNFGFRIMMVYNKSSELSEMLSLTEDERAELYGEKYRNFTLAIQIDWSVNSMNNWLYDNCKEYWDVLKKKSDGYWEFQNNSLGTDISEYEMLFDFGSCDGAKWFSEDPEAKKPSPSAFEPYVNGLYYKLPIPASITEEVTSSDVDESSDDAKPVQVFDAENSGSGEQTGSEYSFIDLAEHTIYVRARYVSYCWGDEDIYIYSDWSAPCMIGKDAVPSDLTLPEIIDPPSLYNIQIANTDMTSNEPEINFDVKVPYEVKLSSSKILALTQNKLALKVEMNVDNQGWSEVEVTDSDIYQGKNSAYVPSTVTSLNVNSWIQLRARYVAPDNLELTSSGLVFASDYSEILEINKEFYEEQKKSEQTSVTESSEPVLVKKKVCTICGICNQPFGICILIWSAISVAAVLFIAFIILALTRGKKKICPECSANVKNKLEYCPECGHKFVDEITSSNKGKHNEYDENDDYTDEDYIEKKENKIPSFTKPTHTVKKVHMMASRIPKPFKKQSFIYCQKCGSKNDAGSKFCYSCGNRIN